ncbi:MULTISPECIES: aminotransferase class IV [Exiguobacterium]|uniref:Aminotransferase class IV n=1 Tax=Exiguobacterium sp. (strain ATCC BAA-1283 / AT1b) TaxID=360911 RepID=C4KZT3_EXISA|nr:MULTISPECIES: aminotransferase class IV [unclassified Exiguobacterium]ACQ70596.1 aminotransferase class IV [Exiguobacterium sp. AT1b]QLQ23180.1 MAG: aminotransferase class IV [Paracoccaceae bacterium]
MWYWHNGELVEREKVLIPVEDHGFLYGMGLFETFRTYEFVPFLFDAHWERLMKSLDELWIDFPYTKEEIGTAIQQLCRQNDAPDLYIRLNVSAGVAPLGLYAGRYETPNVTMIVKPLSSEVVPQEKRVEPIPFPRSRPEAAFRLKSHHYMNNILGKRTLQDQSAEGLFADEHGRVVEGLVSNIFWVGPDDRLYTTPLSSGALAGVTRQWVMDHFSVVEQPVTFEELTAAKEIWMTNSIQQVAPVTHYGNLRYPGKDGVRFNEVWAKLVRSLG